MLNCFVLERIVQCMMTPNDSSLFRIRDDYHRLFIDHYYDGKDHTRDDWDIEDHTKEESDDSSSQ